MPKVTFLNDNISKEVTSGTLLPAVVDSDPAISLMFGCRRASCGTCVMTPKGGSTKLPPPSEREQEVLTRIGAKQGQRLGCQCVVEHDLEIEHDKYW